MHMMANRSPHVLYWLGVILAVLSVFFLWPAAFAALLTAIPALLLLFMIGTLFELFRFM